MEVPSSNIPTACESAHSSAGLLAFPPKPQHNHPVYETAGNAVPNTPLLAYKGGNNKNIHNHNHYIVRGGLHYGP